MHGFSPKSIKAYKATNRIPESTDGMECVVQKILLRNELRNPIFRRNKELGETTQSSKFGSVLGAKPETTHEDDPSSGSRKIL